MKICAINTVAYGSTGRIMLEIAEKAQIEKNKNETYTFSMKWRRQSSLPRDNHFYFGSFLENALSIRLGKCTGMNGCFAILGTQQLLKKLDVIKPDVIHLHNLHNCYVNVPMLFRYICKNDIKVIWTLHDCWAFTGGCTHFTIAGCDRWKKGCYACPQFRRYPSSDVDRTKIMWKLKKKWFTRVDNMTIVTPSKWLARLVEQSFLSKYPIKVINNGIDLTVFRPMQSTFRKEYGISRKYVVLGVALGWDTSKGVDVFNYLARNLDENYQVVLVGTNEKVDESLESNILSIHRTQNQHELVKIYSGADVFVNPTREDNYPTVNMEAIACGIPIVTFETGGAAEVLTDSCGVTVQVNDVNEMKKKIMYVCEQRPFSKEKCVERAGNFDKNKKYEEYVKLYEK